MTIQVIRKWFSEKSTLGEMFIDGVFHCYTLEDKDRGLQQTDSLVWIKTKKIFGVTAIPYGTYHCKLTMSNRFQRVLPEIMDVKGFAGVRIHAGNSDVDTEGCVLLGKTKGYDRIFESRLAVSEFLMKVANSRDFTLIISRSVNI
jgi:hypothetical protein